MVLSRSTQKNVKSLAVVTTILSILLYTYWKSAKSDNPVKILPRHNMQQRFGGNIAHRDGIEHGNTSLSLNEKLLEDIAKQRLQLEADRLALEREEKRLAEEREADRQEILGIAVKLGLQKLREEEDKKGEGQQTRRERQQYLDSLGPAHAQYYMGLDSQKVHTRYPGIAFLSEYRTHEFLDPEDSGSLIMRGHPKTINDVDDYLAEERFYELVGDLHIECLDIRHMGNAEDGGWDVCLSPPYEPTNNDCLVYSFGINNDFTFDDAMMYAYGCYVMAFDPSMTIGDHKHNPKVWFYQLGLGESNTVNELGWKLQTLGSILTKAGHRDRIIDVLKIDIDYNEWSSFKTIFKENVLPKVKQLVLEIHTPEVHIVARESVREDYFEMYDTLLQLEKLGFRRFQVHYNHFGQFISYRSGKHRTCCYEMSYININYLHT